MSDVTKYLSCLCSYRARSKRVIPILFLMVMVSQVIGCSSPTPVGKWKTDSFQPANPELKGPGTLEVNIREDQTFTAVYESKDKSIKRGAIGRWDKESERAIRLFNKGGDGPDVTNAELQDGDTLLIIGKGLAEKLERD